MLLSLDKSVRIVEKLQVGRIGSRLRVAGKRLKIARALSLHDIPLMSSSWVFLQGPKRSYEVRTASGESDVFQNAYQLNFDVRFDSVGQRIQKILSCRRHSRWIHPRRSMIGSIDD